MGSDINIAPHYSKHAGMLEQVDNLSLDGKAERRKGSSPFVRTLIK